MSRHAHPSPRALRVLGALLPRDLREAVIGDLLEHAQAGGRFWPQAVRTALALLPRRVLELLRRIITIEVSMTGLVTDLRSAARTLRRAPLFTSAAVLTLGVAIAAVVTIYGVTAPVVLRPLPYDDPSRVVLVQERDADGRPTNMGFATGVDLAARAHVLERSAMRGSWDPVLTGTGAQAERVNALRVGWQYFATLGVHPALGRDFTAADDTPEERLKVILSHGLWQRRYGSDPAIVGREIEIGGTPMTVVGVMPADFEDALAPDAQLWRVLGYRATQDFACRSCRHLRMVARLRPGVTREAAERELSALSAQIVAEHPKDYPRAGTAVTPLQTAAAGAARAPLVALLAATGLLLLIAIANVAGLQLARAVRRESEFGVRLALGAGRSRLVRQLVGEGLGIALAAGVVGTLLAMIAIPEFRTHVPEALPGMARAHVDAGALAVAFTISLVAAMLVGVAPLWRLERRSNTGRWRAGARSIGGGARAARAAIVAGEIAVATVLLAAAGLVGRSLVTLLAVDPGFRAERLLTAEYSLTGSRYGSAPAVYTQHREVVDRVRALPGVAAAGVINQLPLGGNVDMYGVRAADKPLANPELAPSADRYVVSHGLFAALGLRLERGRLFDAADERPESAPVALVSASLARRIWPGEDPVGKRVQIGADDTPWMQVIGVVADVRHSGLEETEPQQLYIPMGRFGFADTDVTLAVRTTGDPAALAGAVRRALTSLDPGSPVGAVATMDQVIARSTAQRRLALQLLGAFGAIALLLTIAGLYALLAGSVAERTRELGVRSALGATPRALVTLVLHDAARLTSVGLVLGLAGAVAGTRMLRSLLFGVSPGDPATLAAIAMLLACVATVACLVPARRATRIAPTEALRGE